jgi:hypothetical protein
MVQAITITKKDKLKYVTRSNNNNKYPIQAIPIPASYNNNNKLTNYSNNNKPKK